MTIVFAVRRFVLLAIPMAAILLSMAAPLGAVDSVEAQVESTATDPHADLYAAIEEGVDKELMLDNIIDTALTEIINIEPMFELMEAERPGFLDGMGKIMRPILARHSNRLQEIYRPQMIAIFKGGLNADEATQIATFYRSEVGRKLLGGVGASYTGAQSVRSAIENPDGEIPRDKLEADIERAGIKAYLSLSAAERQIISDTETQTPAFAKFSSVLPAVNALRFDMENAPLSPEDEAAIETDLTDFIARHLSDEPDE